MSDWNGVHVRFDCGHDPLYLRQQDHPTHLGQQWPCFQCEQLDPVIGQPFRNVEMLEYAQVLINVTSNA